MADLVSNALGKKPPLPKNSGGTIANDDPLDALDSARYLLRPDTDFSRPYISIPGGAAFVWPLGTEGFEIQDQAELGRHKYIGSIELDVEVMHRDEVTITLSGMFPGHTATVNMQALRQIFMAEQPPGGKILSLPGVLTQAQFVVMESLRHSHGEDDRMQDLMYNLVCVRIGTGADTTKPAITSDIGSPIPVASGTRTFTATTTVRTLRTIAKKVYGNENDWTRLYSEPTNAKIFNKLKLSTQVVPSYRLPVGTKIKY